MEPEVAEISRRPPGSETEILILVLLREFNLRFYNGDL